MEDPPLQSAKDFSDYYHESIALSLEKVDNFLDQLYYQPALIINMNNEIEKIFRRIHNRISPDGKKKQNEFTKQLDMLKPALPVKIRDRESSGYKVVVRITADYKQFRKLVKERLVHIWDCLDELGMTSKKKESETVYS